MLREKELLKVYDNRFQQSEDEIFEMFQNENVYDTGSDYFIIYDTEYDCYVVYKIIK